MNVLFQLQDPLNAGMVPRADRKEHFRRRRSIDPSSTWRLKTGGGSEGEGAGRVEVLRVPSAGALPSASVLLIRNAARSDAGFYRCAMRGDAGEDSLYQLTIRGACRIPNCVSV